MRLRSKKGLQTYVRVAPFSVRKVSYHFRVWHSPKQSANTQTNVLSPRPYEQMFVSIHVDEWGVGFSNQLSECKHIFVYDLHEPTYPVYKSAATYFCHLISPLFDISLFCFYKCFVNKFFNSISHNTVHHSFVWKSNKVFL